MVEIIGASIPLSKLTSLLVMSAGVELTVYRVWVGVGVTIDDPLTNIISSSSTNTPPYNTK